MLLDSKSHASRSECGEVQYELAGDKTKEIDIASPSFEETLYVLVVVLNGDFPKLVFNRDVASSTELDDGNGVGMVKRSKLQPSRV